MLKIYPKIIYRDSQTYFFFLGGEGVVSIPKIYKLQELNLNLYTSSLP